MARRGAASKRRRLSRSAEFDRAYRHGRSHANRYLVLYVFPSDEGHGPRLGVSAGRRVGGAVERNRVKRTLREAFGACAGELPSGFDYVLSARPEAADLARRRGSSGMEETLRELLEASGLTEATLP